MVIRIYDGGITCMFPLKLHRLTFSSRHSTRVRLEFSNEIETTDNKRESTETEANEGEGISIIM